MLSRFYQSSEYKRIFIVYRWFDKLVAKRLKHYDFDCVIGYENSNLSTFREAKRLGKTTILDFSAIHHAVQKEWLTKLGTYPNTNELEAICAHKAAAFQYTDYIFTLSKLSEETLLRAGFPKDRIFKTYLGVNNTVFTSKWVSLISSFETTELENNTKQAAKNQKPFELYFVGTMTKRKGLPFLKDVHETLLSKGLNIRLTLIGPADDYATPEKETPQYRYFPFMYPADLVKMHHHLDLFVFPSYLDSWGQVVVEAMSCGSPALVSNLTGAKDVVEIGGGRILPIDDKAAWIEAIEYFYFNREALKTVGEQAAEAAKGFSWEAYNQQVISAIQRLVLSHKS